MAELNNKKLPNLKICVDNTDNSDEEDAVALEDELSEDSDVAEDIDDDSDGVEFNVRIANSEHREQLPKSSDGEISDEDDEEESEESDTGVPETPVLPSVKSRLQPRVEPPPRPKRKHDPNPMPKMEVNRRYENKAGEFITGIDVLSKEAVEKRERRAKRFGLSRSPSLHGEPDIKTLYDSLDITEAVEKDDHEIRLEAVHVRGTDRMSTEDVFKYFAEFPPAVIEWINDTSCNVVWGDRMTCARALLGVSRSYDEVVEEEEAVESSSDKPSIKTAGSPSSSGKADAGEAAREDKEEEEAMETDDDDDLDLVNEEEEPKQGKESEEAQHEKRLTSTESEDPETGEKKKQVREGRQEEDSNHGMEEEEGARRNSLSRSQPRIPWPQGSWRLGKEHPRAKFLFLRYAAHSDKKLPGAEKRSQYYRKYGNPNYGGMKGLVSRSMKRRLMAQAMEDSLRDDEEEEEEEESRPSKRARTSYRQEEQEEGEIVEDEEEQDHHDRGNREGNEDEMDMDKELQHLIRPVQQPRRMKMYADDEEALIKARRAAVGIKVVAETKSIKSRLGRVPAVSSGGSSSGGRVDARLRIGVRSSSPDEEIDYRSPVTDLRSRLGNSYCESPLTAGRSSSGSDLRGRLKQTQDPREQSQVSYEELDMFT